MESVARLLLGDRKLLAWARYTVEVRLGARMSPEGHEMAGKSWSKPVQAVVRTPPDLPSRWVNICLCLMSPIDLFNKQKMSSISRIFRAHFAHFAKISSINMRIWSRRLRGNPKKSAYCKGENQIRTENFRYFFTAAKWVKLAYTQGHLHYLKLLFYVHST
jgi:hypothetical protein